MSINPMFEIGIRIQKLRENKELTQSQLASDLGVRREVVAKWETGLQDLKTEYMSKIADYFNITCDELLTGVKSENVDINKNLGLSDEAIEKIKSLKDWQCDFLSMFLENCDLPKMLNDIYEYCHIENVTIPDIKRKIVYDEKNLNTELSNEETIYNTKIIIPIINAYSDSEILEIAKVIKESDLENINSYKNEIKNLKRYNLSGVMFTLSKDFENVIKLVSQKTLAILKEVHSNGENNTEK
jgi:transcriptional regulator with XRE-family HTH domain